MAERATVSLTINGEQHTLEIDTRTSLLDLLRERLGLTGAKKGCDHGPVRGMHGAGRRAPCQRLPRAGRRPRRRRGGHGRGPRRATAGCIRCRRRSSSTTPSSAGTARPGSSARRSPCWPRPKPAGRATRPPTSPSKPELDAAEIRERMSGNICRCGAYPNIVRASRTWRGEAVPVRARRRRARRRGGARRDAGGAVARRRHEPGRPACGSASRRRRCWSTSRRLPPTGSRSCGRRSADRRRGAEQRSRRRPPRPHPLPRARRGAARRRVGPAAQPGDDRRQPAAADALRVLPGRDQPVQQARAAAPAARPARASTATWRCSGTPSSASPPTPPTWRSRSPPSTRSCACSARRRARDPARRLLPAARRPRRSGTRCSSRTS